MIPELREGYIRGTDIECNWWIDDMTGLLNKVTWSIDVMKREKLLSKMRNYHG